MKRFIALLAAALILAVVPLAAAAPTLISGQQINRLWRLGTTVQTGLNIIGSAGQQLLPAFKVYHPSGGLSAELKVNGRLSLTGGLLINPGGLGGSGVTIDAGLALEAIGGMSGRSLTVSGLGNCPALQTDPNGLFNCGSGVVGSALAGTGAITQLPYFTAVHTLSGSRMFWDTANKRLGVGVKSPKTQLEVAGVLSGTALRAQGTGYTLGGLGVNTTTPLHTLHVNGTAFANKIKLNSMDATDELSMLNSNDMQLVGAHFLAGFGVYLRGTRSTGIDATAAGGALQLLAGGTEYVRVLTTGNVGVGTTNPPAKLAVAGTISGAALNVMGGTSYVLGNTRFGDTTGAKAKVDVLGTVSGSTVIATKLGVGTANVAALAALHVVGFNDSNNASVRVDNNSGATIFTVRGDGVVSVNPRTINWTAFFGQPYNFNVSPTINDDNAGNNSRYRMVSISPTVNHNIATITNGGFGQMLHIAPSFATTGTNKDITFDLVNVAPSFNGERNLTVRGYYFNPTFTSIAGTQTITAFESTAGNVLMGGPSAKMGLGTTAPGSRLSVSGSVIINPTRQGSFTAKAGLALEALGAMSGANLYAMTSLNSSGSLSVNGPSLFKNDVNLAAGADRTVSVLAPAAVGTAGDRLTLAAANGTGNGRGGPLVLRSGQGNGLGGAGNINLYAANSVGSTSANSGGNVMVFGGSMTATSGGGNEHAGSVWLVGGDTNRTANTTGGDVRLTGGSANTSGTGGSVIINPGAGRVLGGNGSIILGNLRGYVGVNTTTPKARLHVVGSGAFTGTLSGATVLGWGGTERLVNEATYVVCPETGKCDYTDIQSALNALPSGGGKVYVRDGTYTLSSKLQATADKTTLEGDGYGTIIQCDGSAVRNCIGTDTTGHQLLRIKGFRVVQTNATKQGNGLNLSDTALSYVDNVRVENFGTGVVLTDTANNTFYNHLQNLSLADNVNCLIVNGTQANMNYFESVRCRPFAGGGGTGVTIVNATGLVFTQLDVEPTAGGGIAGIDIDGTSSYITFNGGWIENNSTGALLQSGAKGIVFNGTVFSSNGTDYIDNATGTAFINARQTGNTVNQLGQLNINSTRNTAFSIAPAALEVQGAVLRIGDPLTAATFTNGIGIKFFDSGVNHASVLFNSSAYTLDIGGSGLGGNTLAIDPGKKAMTFDFLRGTASGANLHAETGLTSSGVLTIKGAATFQTSLSVRGSMSGYTLTVSGFGGAAVNHATCWKAGGTVGYCSTAPDASGICTCN